MSEDKTETPENSAEETAAAENSEEKNSPVSRSPGNPLSRPTDAVQRPGFRNPSNSRSKAQKKRRKKRR